jgi:hypothetical protein
MHDLKTLPDRDDVFTYLELSIFAYKRDMPEESDGLLENHGCIKNLHPNAFEEPFGSFIAKDFETYQAKCMLREAAYYIAAANEELSLDDAKTHIIELYGVSVALFNRIIHQNYTYPVRVNLLTKEVESL